MSSSTADSLADGVQLLRLVDKTSSALMSPPPSEDKAPPSSQKSTSNHSDNNEKPTGEETPTYFEKLKVERGQLPGEFSHAHALLEKEMKRVSSAGAVGGELSEVIIVPVQQYPDYNFVGRILGPRGTTAKQLEASTGCRMTILGRGKKDGSNETVVDDPPLRIQISCPADAPNASQRMEDGVSVVKALLIPPADGQDELKRQQLMVLANMNGTYRPRSTTAHVHAGEYGNGNPYQNLLPYGYRLPVLSKSQQDVTVRSLMAGDYNHSHAHKSNCFNPNCAAILRSLIEHNVPMSKNVIPKFDEMLGVMNFYEMLNRIRLANSSLFGDYQNRDEVVKAQEIGNRMCSALNSGSPRSSSSSANNTTSSSTRRPYKPRQPAKK